MEASLALLAILAVFALLDVIAMRWGADSRERIERQEWEQQKGWPFKEKQYRKGKRDDY